VVSAISASAKTKVEAKGGSVELIVKKPSSPAKIVTRVRKPAPAEKPAHADKPAPVEKPAKKSAPAEKSAPAKP